MPATRRRRTWESRSKPLVSTGSLPSRCTACARLGFAEGIVPARSRPACVDGTSPARDVRPSKLPRLCKTAPLSSFRILAILALQIFVVRRFPSLPPPTTFDYQHTNVSNVDRRARCRLPRGLPEYSRMSDTPLLPSTALATLVVVVVVRCAPSQQTVPGLPLTPVSLPTTQGTNQADRP